ncbi:hypothetical protein ASPZODRAFT_64508 [Penicilliopsis zonata CBS 506.65]|uniref:Major facilitator superfamily (MFS) profile domain-containing protein n=1 Tax=Penicilliopsis zonata CBS 506.65 TaxID=1073090 RepID=A0A1L9SLA1_9EURO|nr:hypothetical protein ASPZODRAFT_64508 [Penicilliopsis zonata CBS 506.65]OJJ47958.1 hypothetical protein ASPZODRAFT_64508 [Penicilliopsis zonata CBS 506.65]
MASSEDTVSKDCFDTDQEKAAVVNASSDLSPRSGGRPECFSNTFQECLFVLTATMAIGQTSFYQGTIVGITASIGSELGMSAAEITWINAGVSLSSGAFLLTFGKLADMFGRKALFIFAMVGFTLAVLIAGFANTPIYMDVFSGIVGLFAAAAVPPAVGALGAVYEKPSKRKNRAFACFSAGNPLGFVGGMIVSGIASSQYNWRASFWALAVLYALFTIMTPWTIPKDTFQRMSVSRESFKRFDLFGTALIVVGFACFSSSLSLAGDAPHGWQTSYVIALIVIGAVLLACFLYWQSKAAYPLMPLHVWRDRNFSVLMAVFCLGFMGFSSTTFWLSLYLQDVKGLSALEITAQLLPMVIGGVLVNVICALVLHKMSNTVLMGIGALAYAAAFLILSFLKESAPYWAFIFPALVLVVVGADITFNVTNMYVMSSLPPEEQSVAGGIFNTVNKLCNNLGLGIATSIYSSISTELGDGSTAVRPYLTTFWFAAASAGLSVFLVPFLTLGTQGGPAPEKAEEIQEPSADEKPARTERETIVYPEAEIMV